MTNREYLRNLLTGITAELAAIKPDDDTPNTDFYTLESAIQNAIRSTSPRPAPPPPSTSHNQTHGTQQRTPAPDRHLRQRHL